LVKIVDLADGEDAVLLVRVVVDLKAGDEILWAHVLLLNVEIAVAMTRPIKFAELRLLLDQRVCNFQVLLAVMVDGVDFLCSVCLGPDDLPPVEAHLCENWSLRVESLPRLRELEST